MAGLFKWGTKSESGPAVVSSPRLAAAAPDTLSASKVLPRFLSALSSTPAPVLMDLGPVVGPNISFFGEQLSCKIFVEDLFAAIDTHLKTRSADTLPLAVAPRLSHAPGTIDGILCWDLFDFLDKKTAQTLATRLVALLRPGGALYGFFGTAAGDISHYTRFIVEGADLLRLRTAPVTPTKRNVIVNRDITKMFEGLLVKESVLLKTSTREILFRKP